MRVFFKEGAGNPLDISKEINKYKSDTYLMSMDTNDAIYIATDFPLNHLFVKMGETVNESPSNLVIDYWSGNGWISVVNQNDYTVAFSATGFIEFTPDRAISWKLSNTNYGGNVVEDLETISVYDKYWIRIKVDADLDDDIELEYIGHKFSEDMDLFGEYPIFNDAEFLELYETDKTTWEEQAVIASDLIIQDLKRKNIIFGAEQILDREILRPACVQKVAEIIFNAFGKDYRDQKLECRKEYDTRMDLSKFVVDTNNNGIEDQCEKQETQGWLSR